MHFIIVSVSSKEQYKIVSCFTKDDNTSINNNYIDCIVISSEKKETDIEVTPTLKKEKIVAKMVTLFKTHTTLFQVNYQEER